MIAWTEQMWLTAVSAAILVTAAAVWAARRA